jgi:hypothetical protein
VGADFFANVALPNHHLSDMAHLSERLVIPTRGASRFRLAIKLRSAPPRPYAWEIYEDERDEKAVRQSALRFRTSQEAWSAGFGTVSAYVMSSIRDVLSPGGTSARFRHASTRSSHFLRLDVSY